MSSNEKIEQTTLEHEDHEVHPIGDETQTFEATRYKVVHRCQTCGCERHGSGPPEYWAVKLPKVGSIQASSTYFLPEVFAALFVPVSVLGADTPREAK